MERQIFLIRLSQMIGLCPFHYEAKKRRFLGKVDWLTIYWVLLHLAYLLLTPCIFLMTVQSSFDCQSMDMIALGYTVVTVAKASSIALLVCNLWLQRSRLRRMGNEFLKLEHQFIKYIPHNMQYWKRYTWKLLLTCCRFMLIVHEFFGPTSALQCGKLNVKLNPIDGYIILLAIAALLVESIVSMTDYWHYFMVGSCNGLLEYVAQQAKELSEDFRWLPVYPGSHRRVYQQQLLGAWRQLWRYSVEVDTLLKHLLQIFQWQILINLYSSYITDVAVVFSLVIFINESEDYTIWRGIVYFLLCLGHHADVMTNFSIFSSNRDRWNRLLTRLEKLWIGLSSIEIDRQHDTQLLALKRQLEFALLSLNRQLQRRPERIRRLHIAGLFDLSRSSAYSVNSSVAIKVVILWQIAYKYYF